MIIFSLEIKRYIFTSTIIYDIMNKACEVVQKMLNRVLIPSYLSKKIVVQAKYYYDHNKKLIPKEFLAWTIM